MVEEGDVEGCVVHDQLGPFEELDQLVDNIDEFALVLKKLVVDAMNIQGAFVDLALRVQIIVKAPPRQPAAFHLHRRNLDNAVAKLGLEACRFRIDKNLAHPIRFLSPASAVRPVCLFAA